MAHVKRASILSIPSELGNLGAKGDGEDKAMETLQDHVYTRHYIAMVDRTSFAFFMAGVVMCNVVCIGFETEFSDKSEIFAPINNGFLLIYIIELMMRMLTHGLRSFRDVFTVMDLILVVLAFLERVLTASALARALPTFRLLRLFRLLRQRFKTNVQLRAISTASVRMLRTLAWVVVFLFGFLWIMATFAHLVIGHSAEWNETMDPSRTFPPFTPLDIQEYFGSVWKSFVTLLQVATLSQWAPHIGRRIVKVYPMTFFFFLFFLFVTSYGLLVSIVANLVQDSMAASRESAKAIAEKEMEQRRRAGLQARDILAEVDADGSGELDVDEIRYALEVTDLPEILKDLGVPVLDAVSLVRLLDHSGNGEVSYEELIEGVVKMDAEITKRDYAMMAFWVKNLLQRTSHLEDRLAKLCDTISFIRKRLGGSFGALNHMVRTAKDSQLRQRSIHALRTQGPALPPPIEKKIIVKPTLHRNAHLELQNSLGRFLGEPPKPKRIHSPDMDEAPRTTALFRNTMGDAPPALNVGLRRAKREEARWADRYAIRTDLMGKPGVSLENRNVRSLKSLI